MRKLALLLALLGACVVEPAVTVVPRPENAIQTAVDHTVFLDDAGCSAVAVGEYKVVTAKHCVNDDAEVGDQYESGKLTYISDAFDFAVFTSDDPRTYAGPPIHMRPARFGEHVYVVGFPVQLFGEQELTITDGIVAGPVDHDFQSRITAPVYFGNSGGGVWGDDGALLGIAVSIYAANVPGARYPLPYVAQAYMVPIGLVTLWL